MSLKIIQIHNRYRLRAGEDYVFEATCELLSRKGNSVLKVTRDSQFLEKGLIGKLHAFSTGIYSPSAYDYVTSVIAQEKPDVVHIHNLYPLISPSVLVACRRVKVPVVMTCHNYRLMCPIGIYFHNGKVCESCARGREYWCILKNCRGNIFESIGYALRNAVARKFRLFAHNVSIFITTADFTKQRMVEAGFSKDRVVVVPYAITMATSKTNPSIGKDVVYVGRLSPEKGVETFIAAARLLPQLKFVIAGDGPIRKELEGIAPENVTFVGWLNKAQLSSFYSKARLAVVPSTWLEQFGLVVTDAMSNGLPVVASRIGGPSEIVEEAMTGVLFQPGNSVDLAQKINNLWTNPDLCRRMGKAGREKAIREYSEDVYYGRLMAVYKKAIEIN